MTEFSGKSDDAKKEEHHGHAHDHKTHHEHKEHSHEHKTHEHKTGHHTEHKTHHAVHHAHHKKKSNSGMWMAISGVLGILLLIAIFTGGFGIGKSTPASGDEISTDEAKEKALGYINTALLAGQGEATIESIEDAGDLYKIDLVIAGSQYNSYITKDGKMLFPTGFDMDQEVETPEAGEQPSQPSAPAPTVETKMAVPEVELFVMTHCPFGTQIEKGMLPVAELLGDKIDLDVKFVYYAMHGEKEVEEQLLQYCIQEEYNDKYLDYLTCFLEAGETDTCLEKVGLTMDDLNTCITETDEEFKVRENLADQSTWLNSRFPLWDVHKEENEKYGVRGSPQLVINGAPVSSGRDAASLLAAVCNGFEEPPEECGKELDSTNPSPGFGYNPGSASATDATCE